MWCESTLLLYVKTNFAVYFKALILKVVHLEFLMVHGIP